MSTNKAKGNKRGSILRASLPNLLEIQFRSYEWFKTEGLKELLKDFSPMEDFAGRLRLEFVGYRFGDPKRSEEECREQEFTYERPLWVKVRLVDQETGEMKESEVYFGDIPEMTERGTFIINGMERVVVSQLSRSPGLYFEKERWETEGRWQGYISPDHGLWLHFGMDEHEGWLWGAIGQAGGGAHIGKQRRIPFTTLLRAWDAFDDAEGNFNPVEEVPAVAYELADRIAAETLYDPSKGRAIVKEGEVITLETAKEIERLVREGKLAKESSSKGEGRIKVPVYAEDGTVELAKATGDNLHRRTVAATLIDAETGEVVAEEGEYLVRDKARKIARLAREEKLVIQLPKGFEERQREERKIKVYHNRPLARTHQILRAFGRLEVMERPKLEDLLPEGEVLLFLDAQGAKTKVKVKPYAPIDEAVARKIVNASPEKVAVIRIYEPILRALERTLEEDPVRKVEERLRREEKNEQKLQRRLVEEALVAVYRKLRPGDPGGADVARRFILAFLFEPRRFKLSKVGRHKINRKLGLNIPLDVQVITKDDLLGAAVYLVGLVEKVKYGAPKRTWFADFELDDIDSLRHKRVRSVGELLLNEMRTGMIRLDRLVRERLTQVDPETATPEEVLKRVISAQPIQAVVHAFFATGQLSQFMDQVNPLAELTHKRRLTVLGPGGLTRQTAKLRVRDVHSSHYGRICPIETPEGPNIGLMTSMASHARIDEFGFIQTPYRRVKCKVRPVPEELTGRILAEDIEVDGEKVTAGTKIDAELAGRIAKACEGREGAEIRVRPFVTEEVIYLNADQEEEYYNGKLPGLEGRRYIASSSANLDEDGNIVEDEVVVRWKERFLRIRVGDGGDYEAIGLIDFTPEQVFSVSTSLIPFLENDDANRALMGSNMQRQAVPLVVTEPPLVRTGIEEKAALDSGAVVVAKEGGKVVKVSAEEIVIQRPTGELDHYRLRTFGRSNQGTCIHQKPLVRKGEIVKKGQVIADGPCTSGGKLALGKNLLVVFMPWEGYNYEDAIVISERLVKEDVLTSVHIEKYECEAHETRLGPDEITRDIPNVDERQLKNLDERGIVRIGAEVSSDDILVGKVSPKGPTELTVEEKLLIAIFGKKAEEMRDTSLRMKHGEHGKVIRVTMYSRFKYQCPKCGKEHIFSKEPDHLFCERCRAELKQIPGDELKPGINALVRVFVAQRRKISIGDKLAGRHGNKGVISNIVAEEDMPYLPDGTPVDIVLNPLGVPSRMNMGQILETHLGLVKKELGIDIETPVFRGAKWWEIREWIREVARRWEARALANYLPYELGLLKEFNFEGKSPDEIYEALEKELMGKTLEELERLSELLGLELYEGKVLLEEVRHPQKPEEVVAQAGEPLDPERAMMLRCMVKNGILEESALKFDEGEATKRGLASAIMGRIKENIRKRTGLDPETGKCWVIDGRTGEPFSQPVTVGYMYILKLIHMAEDKIHARSTGPYSLVTQQPLGGRAHSGGQRFGEMEVWALEAYGAAHTLQEMLTIKSDDVAGRVRTYEAIVKGEPIQEPGIPESFKILVKELQSLGLLVEVEREGQVVDISRETEEDVMEIPRWRPSLGER